MTTVILVSVLAPIAAGALFLAARHRLPKPAADTRGIALQTIIVMVVLLAIAGAVAAVLLNRAGSETDRLENETVDFKQYDTEFGCRTVQGHWTGKPVDDRNDDGDGSDKGEGECQPPPAPEPADNNG